MVQLLIDGKRVNLSSDTSFEFYDRNPLFSKEGQHTLDIDIDLGDPVNANIYKNMYRIDVLRRPSGRSAVLFSERGVIIRGTEVVLQVDDRVAKIQLVAGNSELNYLSGGDSYIKDLDLGEITNLDITTATQSLQGTYPTWDYVCAPVCTQTQFFGDIMPFINHYEASLMNEMERKSQNVIGLKDNTTLCPQPYLAAMVRKVITALGYTFSYNFIETDASLKKIILVNGYHSVKYNEMVPNWKVDEFLSEVEKFTGCIIVANQIEKTVQIIQANAFYQNAGYETVDADDVIGEIDKKFNEDAPEGVFYHNVRYKFPDSEIYRYWDVDREFINSLRIQQCPNLGSRVQHSRFFYFLIDIWTAINNGNIPAHECGLTVPGKVKEEYNKMIAYEDLGMPALGTYFVLRNAGTRTSSLRRLNYYGARHDDRTEDTMELRIVPAEIVWDADFNWGDQQWQQPYLLARNADTVTTVTSENEEKGLNELIADDSERQNNADVMYAAFYLGYKDNNYSYEKRYQILSPTAVPSNEVERFYSGIIPYGWDGWWELQEIVSFGEPQCCMSINATNGMYNTFWKNNLNVNFTQPYTIRFRNTRNRDARNIFVIANKKFYCQQLKYNIDGGKVSEVVEGTFFPLIGDADTPQEGEDINILVRFDTLNGYVKLYADKTLDYPITVQITGTAGGTTYSGLITMLAGSSQKSVSNDWIGSCEAFTASIYAQESDDLNNYSFNVVVDSYQTINIGVTLSGHTAAAVADAPVNGYLDILLVVIFGDETEEVVISMSPGDTTGSATSTGDLGTRTSATATPYSLDAHDRTVYEVSIQ